MFQNQTFKQKLSYTKDDDEEKQVVINISLTTNHEIDKNIIKDIEDNISTIFLTNYTNTEDLVLKKSIESEAIKKQKLIKQEELRTLKENNKASQIALNINKQFKNNNKKY